MPRHVRKRSQASKNFRHGLRPIKDEKPFWMPELHATGPEADVAFRRLELLQPAFRGFVQGLLRKIHSRMSAWFASIQYGECLPDRVFGNCCPVAIKEAARQQFEECPPTKPDV